MITLYQFQTDFGLPNLSPFCLKLETYLRMVDLAYNINQEGDLTKAPKGKMPYISDDGKILSDTSIIIDYLAEKHGKNLDAHLNPVEMATALAMQYLIEEHLYWVALYSRWMEEDNWPKIREIFFGMLPPVIKSIVPIIARKTIQKNLVGHSMGRHTPDEIYWFGKKDIQAIADFLGDKPYFMGDKPTSLDAAAFGLLSNILWVPLPSPLKKFAQKFQNLEAFCERMRSQYFPEMQPKC